MHSKFEIYFHNSYFYNPPLYMLLLISDISTRKPI